MDPNLIDKMPTVTGRCFLPSRWVFVQRSGFEGLSDDERQHLQSCPRCQTNAARWMWALEHPPLLSLVQHVAASLDAKSALAMKMHLDRKCERCEGLIESAWLHALAGLLPAAQQSWHDARRFFDWLNSRLESNNQPPSPFRLALPGAGVFAAASEAEMFVWTCSGVDIEVCKSPGEGGSVLSLTSTKLPPGAMLRLEMPALQSNAAWERLIVLRESFALAKTAAAIVRIPVCLGSHLDCTLVDPGKLSDDDETILRRSFEETCLGNVPEDRASLRSWQQWSEDYQRERKSGKSKLMSAIKWIHECETDDQNSSVG